MIDLAQLQRMIADVPPERAVAGVTARFLKQVEQEIREGRAARALLDAHDRIAEACDAIRDGCPA